MSELQKIENITKANRALRKQVSVLEGRLAAMTLFTIVLFVILIIAIVADRTC